MTEKTRISIVDDEAHIASYIGEVASQLGYDVTLVTSAKLFLAQLDEQPRPDILILDVVMPEFDGIELMQELVRRKLDSKIVGITGHNLVYLQAFQCIADASDLNYVGSITKPIKIEALESLFATISGVRAERECA